MWIFNEKEEGMKRQVPQGACFFIYESFSEERIRVMKLIHLSDLHIGKRVNEFSMLEDQSYILSQILAVTKKEQPDCVIVAGDIYDKPVPSAEAVQIFDDFLTRLAEMKIPGLMISGNHDSAQRLSFGARLMKETGIYFSHVYDGTLQKVEFCDEYGGVDIYLLPFIRPSIVRHVFPEEETESYQDAVRTALEHVELETSHRNILAAHQFVTGASRCESEEISVGGMDQIDISLLDAFDYVALGHIHSPQSVGRETVRYCGTPLASAVGWGSRWAARSLSAVFCPMEIFCSERRARNFTLPSLSLISSSTAAGCRSVDSTPSRSARLQNRRPAGSFSAPPAACCSALMSRCARPHPVRRRCSIRAVSWSAAGRLTRSIPSCRTRFDLQFCPIFPFAAKILKFLL